MGGGLSGGPGSRGCRCLDEWGGNASSERDAESERRRPGTGDS